MLDKGHDKQLPSGANQSKPPEHLFVAALVVSSLAALASAVAAPFLDDIADTVDIWMRLQNLLIFGVGLVQSMPASITPSFADSACAHSLGE